MRASGRRLLRTASVRAHRQVDHTTAPATATAASLFAQALTATTAGAPVDLSAQYQGASRPLPVSRWCEPVDRTDRTALDRLCAWLPPAADVLDLGCGPGRHTADLHARGVRALGVDSSPVAVAIARRRGAPALVADALGPLPGGHHRWDGVLLLDGNVGIGGHPLLLLRRVQDLLQPTGVLLLELDPQDVTDRGQARLSAGPVCSPPFAWARLGAGGLRAVARGAELGVLDTWSSAGRSFALLSPTVRRPGSCTSVASCRS